MVQYVHQMTERNPTTYPKFYINIFYHKMQNDSLLWWYHICTYMRTYYLLLIDRISVFLFRIYNCTSLFHLNHKMSKNNVSLVVFFVPKKKILFSMFCTISWISDLRTNIRNTNLYKYRLSMYLFIVEVYHQHIIDYLMNIWIKLFSNIPVPTAVVLQVPVSACFDIADK